jgi:hypothetical protein
MKSIGTHIIASPAGRIFFILALFLYLNATSVNAKNDGTYPLAFSILSPVELPFDAGKKVHGLHFGLFYGQSKETIGLAMMWMGAYKTDDKFSGVDFAHVNIVDRMYGVQSAVFVNVVRIGRGWQGAGIVDVYKESFYGLQTGLINCGVEFKGLQGGLVNVNSGDFSGWQIGGVNYAGKLRGVQSGFINFSPDAGGLQAGLINFSRNGKGVMIGLLNFIYGQDVDFKYVLNIIPNNRTDSPSASHEIQIRTRGSLMYGSYAVEVGTFPNSSYYAKGSIPIMGFGFGTQPFLGSFFVDAGLTVHVLMRDIYTILPAVTVHLTPGYSFFNKNLGVFAGISVGSFGSAISTGIWFRISSPEGRQKIREIMRQRRENSTSTNAKPKDSNPAEKDSPKPVKQTIYDGG